MAIRTTILALLALVASGCPASQKDVYKAQTSGYRADFAIVYSNVLAAVSALYPHLAENPAAGVIRTAWHQVRIRQGDDSATTRATVGPAVPYDPTDPNSGVPSGSALQTNAGPHPGGTIYFVRFNVFVLGGKPWRVRVEAEAAEWEAGMKQAKLKGAERPPWLKGRTDALQVAIYRRLRKYAVPLRTNTQRRKPEAAVVAPDLGVYGDIPRVAAERVHALREALLAGKFDAVRGFLVDDFVWSAGGAPSADQAVIVWQADPTLASRLIDILRGGCAVGDGDRITCPPTPAAGALRATFGKRGELWMLTSFVAE